MHTYVRMSVCLCVFICVRMCTHHRPKSQRRRCSHRNGCPLWWWRLLLLSSFVEKSFFFTVQRNNTYANKEIENKFHDDSVVGPSPAKAASRWQLRWRQRRRRRQTTTEASGCESLWRWRTDCVANDGVRGTEADRGEGGFLGHNDVDVCVCVCLCVNLCAMDGRGAASRALGFFGRAVLQHVYLPPSRLGLLFQTRRSTRLTSKQQQRLSDLLTHF